MAINCLACDGVLEDILFSIKDLPLVDSFSKTPQEARAVRCYSIDLRQCKKCSTIQVALPPDTSDIYRNYIYESSSSPDLEEHFASYADYVASIAESRTTKILEIGANDGLLLKKLSDVGFIKMVGVDPSPQTATIDIKGVEIINDFFCESSVKELERSSFGLIIANNCFSHIPKLSEALALCTRLLEKNGTLIIEVQSCLDLVEGVVFDYIYHEHYFYHTAQSMEKLARLSGLELYRVEHVPTKGGSYRLLLGNPGEHAIDSSVGYWKFREQLAGIHGKEAWHLMECYLSRIKALLRSLVEEKKGSCVGYGASATGTVFMRYMGIETFIDSIVDDNPKRQGLYAPASAIPVRAPNTLNQGDLCIVLAWRHSSRIVPRLNKQSFRFVVPLPSIQISG